MLMVIAVVVCLKQKPAGFVIALGNNVLEDGFKPIR